VCPLDEAKDNFIDDRRLFAPNYQRNTTSRISYVELKLLLPQVSQAYKHAECCRYVKLRAEIVVVL